MSINVGSITPEQAAQALLRRRTIRSDFAAWCRFNGYVPAAHHRLLISKLQLLNDGLITRLAIFCPPGAAKSTYASILFPPFYLANHPDAAILGCAHTTKLAERWGRRARNLIQDNELLLGISLSEEVAVDRWRLNSGGEYKAAGVGTGIAGYRAQCLTGDTTVITRNADPRCVDTLSVGDYILSYGGSQRPEYRKVLAIARRKTDAVWRIRTTHGCVVEATGEHPFYTVHGWQPAASLHVGDVLVRALPKTVQNAPQRTDEIAQSTSGYILQQGMFDAHSKCYAWNGRSQMQNLWKGITIKAARRRRRAILFDTMQVAWCKTAWVKITKSQKSFLRNLWQGIQTSFEYICQSFLLERLSCRLAIETNVGFDEHQLAPWSRSQSLSRGQWSEVPGSEEGGVEARQQLLCYLRCNEEVARSPYRRRQYQQHSDKSGDLVYEVPYRTAPDGKIEITSDQVVMVERICGTKIVYDIQVEDTECFFANGLLVHNCLLIDDPVRSAEDADSKLEQERQWDWYKADVVPRLKPGACSILIQTRWNLGDLAGRILEEMANGGDHWEVLSLPAEARENDPLGRKPGEFLWNDDDYGYADLLREQKRSQTLRNWSALYQQEPAPESGDFFKAEWLRPYERPPARDTLTIYGASDYATTADGGDFTVHIVVGLAPDESLYVLDLWRMQATPDKWCDAFCDLVLHWRPLDWAVEGGQIKASVGPFLERMQRERRAYVNREEFPTKGDKAKRCQSIRGRMAQNGLYIPTHAPWVADFRAELLSFPAGRHDDQVDALGLVGQLLDLMVVPRKPTPPAVKRRDDYIEKTNDDDLSVLGL
jgi:predicted phage terminase large subunit-like protein